MNRKHWRKEIQGSSAQKVELSTVMIETLCNLKMSTGALKILLRWVKCEQGQFSTIEHESDLKFELIKINHKNGRV